MPFTFGYWTTDLYLCYLSFESAQRQISCSVPKCERHSSSHSDFDFALPNLPVTGRTSKKVRISWLWHFIHYLSFLCTQTADPNPFKGTHCSKSERKHKFSSTIWWTKNGKKFLCHSLNRKLNAGNKFRLFS